MSPTPPISRIAIVGATGRVGGAFAEALSATGQHKVTALSRSPADDKKEKKWETVVVNYDDESSIVAALKGQEALIITLNARVPNETHGTIVNAAAKAGVRYIIPNFYGNDPTAHDRIPEGLQAIYVTGIKERLEQVKASGVASILVACGFWYDWSLALGEDCFGISVPNKKAIFYDGGNTKINTSTWARCGEAIAALFSLPESGASPSLSDWKNKVLYIDSFYVSQRDILDSVHRVQGTTDADWTITTEDSTQRLHAGLAELQAGNPMGFAKALYAGLMNPNGSSDFTNNQLANKTLKLNKEDIDACTKHTIDELLKEGAYDPFGLNFKK